ncbi:hypothetical protein BS47DRAFT_1347118 [Hydnum rufescens UP504]|uniref:Uncharacterized protein n=1 Tax=Hydnum rufescens UP504 TaxID=1448309 RepID=A0A9P6ASW5_9AGAM|nr:hypothetical protein BS47DRAFT_1347118 [Hydnum rufescens UP504]
MKVWKRDYSHQYSRSWHLFGLFAISLFPRTLSPLLYMFLNDLLLISGATAYVSSN